MGMPKADLLAGRTSACWSKFHFLMKACILKVELMLFLGEISRYLDLNKDMCSSLPKPMFPAYKMAQIGLE